MTVIKKLVLSEFLKALAFTFIAFFSLFFIIDFVEKVDDFMENKASIGVMFSYFLFKIPFICSQIMPIAVLMATIVSLSLLSKHNEITALKASGRNLIDALTPLMLAGLIISISILFINEVIAPSTERISKEIESKWIKKSSRNKLSGTFTKEGYWIKTPSSIIKIKSLENDNKRLKDVTIYKLDGNLTGSASAEELNWDGSNWKTGGKITSTLKGNEINETLIEIGKPADLGTSTIKAYKDMTFFELRDFIKKLKIEGYSTSVYKVELYSKFSFPFVNFIMVLIGIAFGLKDGRNSGITMSVAIAFLIGFSYWIIFGISVSLGSRGLLPPLISAFFTDILFFAIGVLMLGYVKR